MTSLKDRIESQVRKRGLVLKITGTVLLALGILMFFFGDRIPTDSSEQMMTIGKSIFAGIMVLGAAAAFWEGFRLRPLGDKVLEAIETGNRKNHVRWVYILKRQKGGAVYWFAVIATEEKKEFLMSIKEDEQEAVIAEMQQTFPNAVFGFSEQMKAAFKAGIAPFA